MKQSECQRARESVSRREECFNSEMDWCLQAATYPNSEHDTGFHPASYTKAIQAMFPVGD